MATRAEYPGAERFLPDRPTLKRLRSSVQECQGCDLYRDATQAVFGDGATDPQLVIVGEQPGDVEDRRGEPFVGPAGRLLDKALSAVEIDPASVYRTNAVKHFRFTGSGGKRRIHKKPDRWQVTACQPWLLTELSVLRPPGVVALGATAGQSLLGPSFRVGAMRGKRIDAPDLDCDWVVATTHPSAVLRAPDRDEAFDGLVADLAVAADALHG
ncbi:MAG: UdgX family uracil-DNA binding protein [Actinomycetota bacterium]|nr:UdgX family uracil-DNA binding protein [Actinomycetota bacterium]